MKGFQLGDITVEDRLRWAEGVEEASVLMTCPVGCLGVWKEDEL